MTTPTFTICIATYNRCGKLERALTSVAAQTFQDIQLVVVDDGSTDVTKNVVEAFAESVTFPVEYVWQTNAGRAEALNAAFRAAKGKMVLILDDDDELLPAALKNLIDAWYSIREEERPQFCGVAGLCVDATGHIVGDRYPKDIYDSDFFSIRAIDRIGGDKKEAVLLSCIGDFQFECFPGERRVPTSTLWYSLARFYRTRFINVPCAVKSYDVDGLTKNIDAIRMKSPHSTRNYYRDILQWFPHMPMKMNLRHAANWARYSLHTGQTVISLFRNSPESSLAWLAIPLAILLWQRDRLRGAKLAGRRREIEVGEEVDDKREVSNG